MRSIIETREGVPNDETAVKLFISRKKILLCIGSVLRTNAIGHFMLAIVNRQQPLAPERMRQLAPKCETLNARVHALAARG